MFKPTNQKIWAPHNFVTMTQCIPPTQIAHNLIWAGRCERKQRIFGSRIISCFLACYVARNSICVKAGILRNRTKNMQFRAKILYDSVVHTT